MVELGALKLSTSGYRSICVSRMLKTEKPLFAIVYHLGIQIWCPRIQEQVGGHSPVKCIVLIA